MSRKLCQLVALQSNPKISFSLLLLLILVEYSTIHGQALNFPLNRDYNTLILGSTVDSTYNFHESSKPYLINDLNYYNQRMADLRINTNKKALSMLLNQDTFDLGERKFDVSVTPIIEAVYAGVVQNYSYDKAYSFAAGLSVNAYYDTKIALELNYQYNYMHLPDYVSDFVEKQNVIPGFGMVQTTRSTYSNSFFTGSLSYSPASYVNFQIGKGKQFIGNGYRSLILSDNSNAYPYGKIDINIWKIKYQVLYAQYKDMNGAGLFVDQHLDKYSTSNLLSMNIGKHANLGLFQTVIWQATDSNLNRGFDVNYLNPFIFMRPVEYSIGSPDNVLLGLDFSYLLYKKYKLYTQFIIDEFLLNEVRDNTGWWANKYGFQVGTTINDIFNLNGLTILAEYNYVRPFTYSHSNVVQNYGNYNQPLAHPLGANFDEVIGRITYHKKRWLLLAHVSYSYKGEDFSNTNYGGDIYKSNTTRTKDYDNLTGQGISVQRIYGQGKIGYLINPGWKLMFELGYTYREAMSTEYGKDYTGMIHVGFRTLLYNQYLDF